MLDKLYHIHRKFLYKVSGQQTIYDVIHCTFSYRLKDCSLKKNLFPLHWSYVKKKQLSIKHTEEKIKLNEKRKNETALCSILIKSNFLGVFIVLQWVPCFIGIIKAVFQNRNDHTQMIIRNWQTTKISYNLNKKKSDISTTIFQ